MRHDTGADDDVPAGREGLHGSEVLDALDLVLGRERSRYCLTSRSSSWQPSVSRVRSFSSVVLPSPRGWPVSVLAATVAVERFAG
jgi:hypothetical protein